MARLPGASAAVTKVAEPWLSVTLSRMLPLLLSVKITEPAGVPDAALTVAVKVTGEFWMTEVLDADNVVMVLTAWGVAAVAVTAGPRRPAVSIVPAATQR